MKHAAAVGSSSGRITGPFRVRHQAQNRGEGGEQHWAQAVAGAIDDRREEAAFIGSGGSIPVAGYFQSLLDTESMLIGFGKDDDQIHSPNEKYDVESFHKGTRSWARILEALSRT